MTEVMWQPALRRGRGLEAQGYVVRVWDAGVYLLYSQVTPNIETHMGAWRPVLPEPGCPSTEGFLPLCSYHLEDPSSFLGSLSRTPKASQKPCHPVFLSLSSLPSRSCFMM